MTKTYSTLLPTHEQIERVQRKIFSQTILTKGGDVVVANVESAEGLVDLQKWRSATNKCAGCGCSYVKGVF